MSSAEENTNLKLLRVRTSKATTKLRFEDAQLIFERASIPFDHLEGQNELVFQFKKNVYHYNYRTRELLQRGQILFVGSLLLSDFLNGADLKDLIEKGKSAHIN